RLAARRRACRYAADRLIERRGLPGGSEIEHVPQGGASAFVLPDRLRTVAHLCEGLHEAPHCAFMRRLEEDKPPRRRCFGIGPRSATLEPPDLALENPAQLVAQPIALAGQPLIEARGDAGQVLQEQLRTSLQQVDRGGAGGDPLAVGETEDIDG